MKPPRCLTPIEREAIRPGDCFGNAFRALVVNREAVLVHGLMNRSNDQDLLEPKGHAWLEIDGGIEWWVYDPGQPFNPVLPRRLYYIKSGATATVRYTYKQAVEKALLSGHCGGWDAHINQWCDPTDTSDYPRLPEARVKELKKRGFRDEEVFRAMLEAEALEKGEPA